MIDTISKHILLLKPGTCIQIKTIIELANCGEVYHDSEYFYTITVTVTVIIL